MSKPVAVVVPYYQKKPGILARAIASALDIIVVDDASPVLRGQWRVDPKSFLYAVPLAVGILLKR
jgi:hypothetical protein